MFTEEREEFLFDWSHLGDIDLGRPNLGPKTTVAAYRLMQFTLRDAAVKYVGAETARAIFYDAGKNAGKAFHQNVLGSPEAFPDFVAHLQKSLEELSIGILRVEDADLDSMTFRFTVAEDLDCSGLPLLDEAVCVYDEGFIAGVLEAQVGMPFRVEEVDCWCTGDRVCRFEAVAVVDDGGEVAVGGARGSHVT